MDPGLLRDALTVALGLLTGVMSGLFGVGGAVVSTPGIRVLGVPALLAVGTTLPAIIPGAASGTARYVREGMVDWGVVAVTAPSGVLAAIAGAMLADRVPGEGHVLMLMTAALLGYSAWRMLPRQDDAEVESDRRSAGEPTGMDNAADNDADNDADDGTTTRPTGPRWAFAAVGILAGGLSGLLGIGGGIVMVPGFTQFGGLGVKRAIATSLACVGLFAVPGTITHALLGNIDWRVALLLAVGVIPGARIGAALAIAADDRNLRRVVAIFLGLMAVAYGAGETLALVA